MISGVSSPSSRRSVRAFLIGISLLSLAACGGQSDAQRAAAGNGGQNNGGQSGSSVPYTAGVFQPYASLSQQCSSAAAQNNWLRSWINDTYLWYSEVPDLNPNGNSDTEDFFQRLKTPQVTASGADKDKFHFTYDTDEWIALSQSGVAAGYGAQWFLISGLPPREMRVAYVDPGTPAAAAGLQRGDLVVTIDGVDAINGNTQAIVDTLNAGLFPEGANETHTFTMRRAGISDYPVTLQSANITSTPVQNVRAIDRDGVRTGYILFNDHIATAEDQLIAAVGQLEAEQVTELVLDVRYNGGGYLYIASELAYMIAGSSRTSGMTFERLTFNDKYPGTDPVTGDVLQPMPFLDRDENDNPLPTLNLNRVFVLTGSNTCSASESIINALRGVGVEVIQIGGTTCGKPYGFYPTDNCGTTYFAIQFKGVNAAGFGDYTDGFSPDNTVSFAGTRIPGCSVADDFSHQLGDESEQRLAAALELISGGTCPTAPSGPVGMSKTQFGSRQIDGVMHKSPLLQNRILRPNH